MKSKHQQIETRAHLLPTARLAEKWVSLLSEKRATTDPQERELKFLFAHGWLRALADADLLSDADLPELRELLITA